MDDSEIVNAAFEAAQGVIFSRYNRSEVSDFDLTVEFNDGELIIDVFIDVPGANNVDGVTEEAVSAAESAVDELVAA